METQLIERECSVGVDVCQAFIDIEALKNLSPDVYDFDLRGIFNHHIRRNVPSVVGRAFPGGRWAEDDMGVFHYTTRSGLSISEGGTTSTGGTILDAITKETGSPPHVVGFDIMQYLSYAVDDGEGDQEALDALMSIELWRCGREVHLDTMHQLETGELEIIMTPQETYTPPAHEINHETVIIERPELDADEKDLAVITPCAWAAQAVANKPPRLFIYGQVLVRVDAGADGARIEPLTSKILRYENAQAVDWQGVVHKQKKPAYPPAPVVDAMLSTPLEAIPLPGLAGLTHCPVVTGEGSLEDRPGYLAESRLYLVGPCARGIPANPTVKEITKAKEWILCPYADFPWKSEADKTNAISFMFTPFLLPMIEGNIPALCFDAPVHGTGKGLAAQVTLTPGYGHSIRITPLPENEDETRKKITSLRLEGAGAVVWDNITRMLDSPAIASLLTARTWADRILGKSEIVSVPNNGLNIFTGNNINLSGELTRRTIYSRMMPSTDKPWLRSDFSIENLGEWLGLYRLVLQRAVLTIIQGWIAAGMPATSRRPLGSFESWSTTLGSIMDFAGFPDFLGNQLAFYEDADTEGGAWRALCAEWWAEFRGASVKAAELWPIAKNIDGLPLTAKTDEGRRTSFGILLSKQKDRVFSEYQIKSAGRYNNKPIWKLIRAGDGAREEVELDFDTRKP